MAKRREARDPNKRTRVNLYLDQQEYDLIREMADLRDTSMSNIARYALMRLAVELGVLDKDDFQQVTLYIRKPMDD